MAQKIFVAGQRAWLKRYDNSERSRRAMLRLWNMLAGHMDAGPLRAPPRHSGNGAKRLEMRRLRQLHRQGVRVPRVLVGGERSLVLSDMGSPLSVSLKAAPGVQRVDDLVHDAVAEIVAALRRGAYFGQPFARNITVIDNRIGFIDFEEDPLEIMPLRDAQARDWLIFCAGVSRHYEGRVDALAELLGQSLPQVANEVADEVRVVADRLGFLYRATQNLGRRARALGVAVLSLRKSFGVMLLLLWPLLDFAMDGESDILRVLQHIL